MSNKFYDILSILKKADEEMPVEQAEQPVGEDIRPFDKNRRDYLEGDLIDHPKLGKGIVEKVTPQRIKIFFEDINKSKYLKIPTAVDTISRDMAPLAPAVETSIPEPKPEESGEPIVEEHEDSSMTMKAKQCPTCSKVFYDNSAECDYCSKAYKKIDKQLDEYLMKVKKEKIKPTEREFLNSLKGFPGLNVEDVWRIYKGKGNYPLVEKILPIEMYDRNKRYNDGQMVKHPDFGMGKIVEVRPTAMTVEFLDGSVKSLPIEPIKEEIVSPVEQKKTEPMSAPEVFESTKEREFERNIAPGTIKKIKKIDGKVIKELLGGETLYYDCPTCESRVDAVDYNKEANQFVQTHHCPKCQKKYKNMMRLKDKITESRGYAPSDQEIAKIYSERGGTSFPLLKRILELKGQSVVSEEEMRDENGEIVTKVEYVFNEDGTPILDEDGNPEFVEVPAMVPRKTVPKQKMSLKEKTENALKYRFNIKRDEDGMPILGFNGAIQPLPPHKWTHLRTKDIGDYLGWDDGYIVSQLLEQGIIPAQAVEVDYGKSITSDAPATEKMIDPVEKEYSEVMDMLVEYHNLPEDQQQQHKEDKKHLLKLEKKLRKRLNEKEEKEKAYYGEEKKSKSKKDGVSSYYIWNMEKLKEVPFIQKRMKEVKEVLRPKNKARSLGRAYNRAITESEYRKDQIKAIQKQMEMEEAGIPDSIKEKIDYVQMYKGALSEEDRENFLEILQEEGISKEDLFKWQQKYSKEFRILTTLKEEKERVIEKHEEKIEELEELADNLFDKYQVKMKELGYEVRDKDGLSGKERFLVRNNLKQLNEELERSGFNPPKKE